MSMELDIGPLTWVKGEIDLALERAASELKTHVANPTSDGLKKASAHLHQAHGALVVVGLDGITEFSKTIERLLTAIAVGQATDGEQSIAVALGALTALRGYLDDLVAGHPNQPLKLFTVYRDLVEACGQSTPSPTELFFPDLTQRPPKRELPDAPLPAEEIVARIKSARANFESGLLGWIKSDPNGIVEMIKAVTIIEKTRETPADRSFWWITLGVLDALASGGLSDGENAVNAKKFTLRLVSQIRKLAKGETDVPERALREALYLVACAKAGGEALAVVRAAYRLEGLLPTTEPSEVERLRPHIRRLRELLAAAKDDWNRLSAGTAAALPPFHERITKIAEEGAATEQADYTRLTHVVLQQTNLLRRDPTRHNDTLALEIATALLLAETALEDFLSLGKDFGNLVGVIVDRLETLARGEPLGPLELPNLDAMSRRAQERLLLESVAREVRTNLGAIEQTLDSFFRNPSRQSTLPSLKTPLKQIEGVLVMLGQDRANEVLRECSIAIDRFAAEDFSPSPGVFEEVAKKLSALGIFIECFQHGHADIDEILEPQLATKPIQESTAQEAPAVIVAEQAPAPAKATATHPITVTPAPTFAAPSETSPAVTAGTEDAHGMELDSALAAEADLDFDSVLEPTAPASVEPIVTAEQHSAAEIAKSSEDEIDAELLDIFLEEAREVVATIASHLPRLYEDPKDQENLIILRRSFHTLKGSGRMVGLTELGESAWAVEQIMNSWLHEARAATPALQTMLEFAYHCFREWIGQLEAGGIVGYESATELLRHCQNATTDKTEKIEEPATEEQELPSDGLDDYLDIGATAQTTDETAAEPIVELTIEAEETSSAAAKVDFVAPAASTIRIGDIEVEKTLYDLYIEETRGHIAVLIANLGQAVVPENNAIRAAHTTGSISAATGFMAIHRLARALESALKRLSLVEAIPSETQRRIFAQCAETLNRMHQMVSSGQLPEEAAELTRQVDELRPEATATTVLVAPPSMLEAQPIAPAIEISTEAPSAELTSIAAEQAAIPPEPEAALPEQPVFAPTQTIVPLQAKFTASAAPTTPLRSVPTPPPTVIPTVDRDPADRRRQQIEDEIDEQLLPIFLEESVDLMRNVGEALRAWRQAPYSEEIASGLKRALHTLKGGARMSGAMVCGELLHSMESRIEQATAMRNVQPSTIDNLEASYDRASMMIERLRNPETFVGAETVTSLPEPSPLASVGITPDEPKAEAIVSPKPLPQSVDTTAAAPARAEVAAPTAITHDGAQASTAQIHLRVRASLFDQLVNEAGEVAISRGRIEGEMRAIKASLLDLTDNVIRLRNQLREVEIQAESQMQSSHALITESAQQFDPLEFDRFTRFQEVTRMMAESVNDVSTVQHTLLRNLDQANAALNAQARLTRELSQRLMSVRMLPFANIAERLHRVVRQAAKDAGKRANLDIRQGQIELDRSVLDKMTGPIEHLLRNCVAHGLEDSNTRAKANKDEIGQITLSLAQEGNEIVIAIADDGAGLDFERIRDLGVQRGLIPAESAHELDEAALTQLIFQSGFTTAGEVTTLAGRGVGMDVVKNETVGLGGRILVDSTRGQGSTFRLYLPLTLAVTQAVMVTIGSRRYAIPSSMIEQARELKPKVIAEIRAAGGTEWLGHRYPWRYLAELLGEVGVKPPPARRHWMLLVKGGSDRLAMEVDGLTGNQEIVVKPLGLQLSRVPGLAGATVLANGEIALILNPIALAINANTRERRIDFTGTRKFDATMTTVHSATTAAAAAAAQAPVAAAPAAATITAATIMVVDDSLTVRKISGRLLARHGYHVLTAKDGVDAMEQLGEVIPDVMLVDIEMPRMDGFDLTRNIRSSARLKHIPIIMITSRSADKHRSHAAQIGVNYYMGKPYDEDQLLANIRACINKTNPPQMA